MKRGCEVDFVPSASELELSSNSERRSGKMKGTITEYSVFFVVSVICMASGFVKHSMGSLLDSWELSAKMNSKPDYLELLDIVPTSIFIVWSLFLASIASFFGRKPALNVAAVVGILSGLGLVYNDGSTPCSYVARAFSNIVVSAGDIVCPLYMIEMVHDSTRGIFTVGCTFMAFVGDALEFVFLFSIPDILFCAVLPVLSCTFIFLFFWLPESPYYLAYKGKMIEAERSLFWMRRQDTEILKQELDEIVEVSKPATSNNPCCSLNGYSVGFVTALSLYILRTTGGITVIRQIGFECSGPNVTSRDVHCITIILKLVSSFLGSLAVDRAGRKMMLYLSYGGACLAFIVICITYNNNSESFRLITMICLFIFSISYGLGYGTITPLVALELTPASSRCKMMAVAAILEPVLSVCVMLSHKPIQIVLGPPVNFIIPAIANFLGIVIVWMVIPETTHQSLRDIQRIQIQL